MTKLLILDKDGTLVCPKSGKEFVQHPEDQELIPGVSEAIARYAANGWKMAIASNQGGVATQKCKPLDFPVGAYCITDTDPPIKIVGKKTTSGGVLLRTAQPKSNGQDNFYFCPSSSVRFQYKTLDDAIAEMRYTMKLTSSIETAYFCPDMEGKQCISVKSSDAGIESFRVRQASNRQILSSYWRKDIYSDLDLNPVRSTDLYRKPGCGMLKMAAAKLSLLGWSGFRPEAQILMVGDRSEDQQAAANAGVDFMWASNWIYSTAD